MISFQIKYKKEQPVDVVVPCYNPQKGWHVNLINSFNYFKQSIGQKCTLILVNDGSVRGINQDHILTIRSAIPYFKFLSYADNKGKGHALRRGMSCTENNYIILTDVDFPYTNESVVKIYDGLLAGNDLMLGYRETSYYRNVPFMRLMISKTYRYLLKILMTINIDDTQCGLKGLNLKSKEIFLQSKIDSYLYALELFNNASKSGLKIDRTVVNLKKEIEFTHIRPHILWQELKSLGRILFE